MSRKKKAVPAPRRGPEPGQAPVIRGDRVRDLRKEAGLTQAAVAQSAGITEKQLRDVESGLRDLQCRGFRRLVVALDTSADYLLGLDD